MAVKMVPYFDEKGDFIFETFETGNQTLVVSYVGYETYEILHNIDEIKK